MKIVYFRTVYLELNTTKINFLTMNLILLLKKQMKRINNSKFTMIFMIRFNIYKKV